MESPSQHEIFNAVLGHLNALSLALSNAVDDYRRCPYNIEIIQKDGDMVVNSDWFAECGIANEAYHFRIKSMKRREEPLSDIAPACAEIWCGMISKGGTMIALIPIRGANDLIGAYQEWQILTDNVRRRIECSRKDK